MGDWNDTDSDSLDVDEFVSEAAEDSSEPERQQMRRQGAAISDLSRRREIEFRLEERRIRDELGLDDFSL